MNALSLSQGEGGFFYIPFSGKRDMILLFPPVIPHCWILLRGYYLIKKAGFSSLC